MEKAMEIDAPAIPARDAADVMNAAAAWRIERGLYGAARRALRISAAELSDPARNPGVALLRVVEEAIEEARRALPEGGDAADLARVQHLGMVDGDVEEARRRFHAVFGSRPEHPELRTLWTLATMEADDTEAGWRAARKHHEETLARFGEQPSARMGLGRCLEALGDPSGAREAFRTVLQSPRLDPALRREAVAALARLP
jgi:hypothetical protein